MFQQPITYKGDRRLSSPARWSLWTWLRKQASGGGVPARARKKSTATVSMPEFLHGKLQCPNFLCPETLRRSRRTSTWCLVSPHDSDVTSVRFCGRAAVGGLLALYQKAEAPKSCAYNGPGILNGRQSGSESSRPGEGVCCVNASLVASLGGPRCVRGV